MLFLKQQGNGLGIPLFAGQLAAFCQQGWFRRGLPQQQPESFGVLRGQQPVHCLRRMRLQIVQILRLCRFAQFNRTAQPVPCEPQCGILFVLNAQKIRPKAIICGIIESFLIKTVVIRIACTVDTQVKMVCGTVFLIGFDVLGKNQPCGSSIRFCDCDIELTGKHIV